MASSSQSPQFNRMFIGIAGLFAVTAAIRLLLDGRVESPVFYSTIVLIVLVFLAVIVMLAISPKPAPAGSEKSPDGVIGTIRGVLPHAVFTVGGRSALFLLAVMVCILGWKVVHEAFQANQAKEIEARELDRRAAIEQVDFEASRLTHDVELLSQHIELPSTFATSTAKTDRFDLDRLRSVMTKANELQSKLQQISAAPDPVQDRVAYVLGITCSLLCEHQKAISYLSSVSQTNESLWPKSQIALAIAHMRNSDHQQARKILDALQLKYPDNSTVAYMIGMTCLRQSDFLGATKAFKECLGMEVGPVIYGDPRLEEAYSVLLTAFCMKQLARNKQVPQDIQRSLLSKVDEMGPRLIAVVNGARTRVEQIGDTRNCLVFLDALSYHQYINDEIVSPIDYQLVADNAAKMSKDLRTPVYGMLLECIQETFVLAGQSASLYLKFRNEEPLYFARFESVRRELPISIEEKQLELEVRNSIAIFRRYDLELNTAIESTDQLQRRFSETEYQVTKLVHEISGLGGTESVRRMRGYQGIRFHEAGRILNNRELFYAGLSQLSEVISIEEKEPAFPSGSGYLDVLKMSLDSAKKVVFR